MPATKPKQTAANNPALARIKAARPGKVYNRCVALMKWGPGRGTLTSPLPGLR